MPQRERWRTGLGIAWLEFGEIAGDRRIEIDRAFEGQLGEDQGGVDLRDRRELPAGPGRDRTFLRYIGESRMRRSTRCPICSPRSPRCRAPWWSGPPAIYG